MGQHPVPTLPPAVLPRTACEGPKCPPPTVAVVQNGGGERAQRSETCQMPHSAGRLLHHSHSITAQIRWHIKYTPVSCAAQHSAEHAQHSPNIISRHPRSDWGCQPTSIARRAAGTRATFTSKGMGAIASPVSESRQLLQARQRGRVPEHEALRSFSPHSMQTAS